MYVRIEEYPDNDSDRLIDIQIDPYDTWNMDDTLARIIVPMLKQLKDTKHGAPNVDHNDVPEELRPTQQEIDAYNLNGATDDKFFERWDYVMDEMIWAFETHTSDWEEQFYSGEIDRITVPVDSDMKECDSDSAKYYEWRKGPNDTFEIDWDGRKAYADRMQKGFELFGRYYTSLWD